MLGRTLSPCEDVRGIQTPRESNNLLREASLSGFIATITYRARNYVKDMRDNYIILHHPRDGTGEVPIRTTAYGQDVMKDTYLNINDIIRYRNRVGM